MENKRYDVASVRSRLDAYLAKEAEIDNQIERLERLETKMEGVGAQVISDMPRSHNASTDRFADMLHRKSLLDEEIRTMVKDQKTEWEAIETILMNVDNPDERAVIRMRYLDRSSWDDVNDMIFGGKKDFLDKEESYKRRVFRLHGAALLDMARYIDATNK